MPIPPTAPGRPMPKHPSMRTDKDDLAAHSMNEIRINWNCPASLPVGNLENVNPASCPGLKCEDNRPSAVHPRRRAGLTSALSY